jgi:hypothetical protein
MNETGGYVVKPGTDAWRAWCIFYRTNGLQKIEARMLAAVADARRARSQWLERLLYEILCSDCPIDDVEVQGHADGRTVIAIRGQPCHVFRRECGFAVPSEFPPAPPAARNITKKPAAAAAIDFGPRRSVGDGELDAVAERFEQFVGRLERELDERTERRRLDREREQRRELALAAVQSNQRPDVADADDLDVIAVVDPNEAEALIHVGRGAPMRLKNARPKMRLRVVALRDDPIGQLAKRGLLGKGELKTDRLAAARAWQAYYEKAEIGGARAIEIRERVDGACFAMPETEQRLRAQQKLRELRDALGVLRDLRITGARLLTWILGDKLSLTKIAELHFGATCDGGRNRLPLRERLCECLDTIAAELSITATAKGRRWRRDQFDRAARYADNPALHNAVRAARTWCDGGALALSSSAANDDKPTLELPPPRSANDNRKRRRAANA